MLSAGLLVQPGGKGANQAVAAARLGADVHLVASVGGDDDGALLLRELQAQGVDTADVARVDGARTGLALVSVYDSGENSIVVVPGANFSVTAERATRAITAAGGDSPPVVVTQAEVLPQIVEAAITSAADAGARVIVNLAPFRELHADLLRRCDPLVVNEAEASALLGWRVHDAGTATRAVTELRSAAASVVVTAGQYGAYWADEVTAGHVPAPTVSAVVDTTGAGDAFVGAMAAELARGASLADAVALGVRAGSFAVQAPGAQGSYPSRADLGVS